MISTYSFDVDPARRVVRITLSGFFGAAEVAQFADAQARAMRACRTTASGT